MSTRRLLYEVWIAALLLLGIIAGLVGAGISLGWILKNG